MKRATNRVWDGRIFPYIRDFPARKIIAHPVTTISTAAVGSIEDR